jgi:hypothetical protein
LYHATISGLRSVPSTWLTIYEHSSLGLFDIEFPPKKLRLPPFGSSVAEMERPAVKFHSFKKFSRHDILNN